MMTKMKAIEREEQSKTIYTYMYIKQQQQEQDICEYENGLVRKYLHKLLIQIYI